MIDCCSAPGLIPLEDAKKRLLSAISPITTVDEVELLAADKRILADTINSPINVPGHNNSAMDGYAFSFNEQTAITTGSIFQLVGTAMAGQPFSGELQPGQCIRIMTGAVVPDTANCVEMQENVTANNQQVTVNQALKLGSHIRQAGEDIKQNQQVFAAHHQINAIDSGLLASLGVSKVKVFRQLKVAVFSTGDELKSANEPLNQGDIYESNRHVIIAMLKRLNIQVIDLGIIPDDKALIGQAFEQANQQADAVISSGGVSVGDADYTKEVLDELGEIGFWKVAIKPGKPFAFGKLSNSVFFGLPGNPVSAAVTFHQLVVPALAKLSNNTHFQPNKQLQATTQAVIKKRPGRMDFQRGVASVSATGNLEVMPLNHQGSGVLSSLSQANCYIVLAQDAGGCDAGEQVTIELFDQLMA